MNHTPRSSKIDELPDRLAHLRKIAERIKLDHPEFAADDPSRAAECGDDDIASLARNRLARDVARTPRLKQSTSEQFAPYHKRAWLSCSRCLCAFASQVLHGPASSDCGYRKPEPRLRLVHLGSAR
jgi:hypothetical protein